jgi:hypothetical protein
MKRAFGEAGEDVDRPLASLSALAAAERPATQIEVAQPGFYFWRAGDKSSGG